MRWTAKHAFLLRRTVGFMLLPSNEETNVDFPLELDRRIGVVGREQFAYSAIGTNPLGRSR